MGGERMKTGRLLLRLDGEIRFPLGRTESSPVRTRALTPAERQRYGPVQHPTLGELLECVRGGADAGEIALRFRVPAPRAAGLWEAVRRVVWNAVLSRNAALGREGERHAANGCRGCDVPIPGN